MDVGTRVELECSYGAGDGRTRSRVASMPKERSGGPRLDRSCDWEKYGYDRSLQCLCRGLHSYEANLHGFNAQCFPCHFSLFSYLLP